MQNFRIPEDNERIQNLTIAFYDAMELVTNVIDTAAWNSPIFETYFLPETRGKVATVFRKIHGGSPYGSVRFNQIIVDNNDFVDKEDPARRLYCTANPVRMYALNTNPQKIHVCPLTYTGPRIRDISGGVCRSSQMSEAYVLVKPFRTGTTLT